MDMEALAELGGLVVGLLLTLSILSYVIGDNPLYRLALHILVGVSAAFAVVITVRDAAVGLVGAITGTLLPQILVQYDQGWLAIVIALLTILTLAYFFFTGQKQLDGRVRMPKWYPMTAGAGRFVLTVTLAGVFAAVINTSFVLLIQRIAYYSSEISRVVELLFS